ncbi:hypothetical protein LCGC14_2402020, partial [marine sediment metagenome]
DRILSEFIEKTNFNTVIEFREFFIDTIEKCNVELDSLKPEQIVKITGILITTMGLLEHCEVTNEQEKIFINEILK